MAVPELSNFHSMIAEPPRDSQGQLGEFNLHEKKIAYQTKREQEHHRQLRTLGDLGRGYVSSPFGMDSL